MRKALAILVTTVGLAGCGGGDVLPDLQIEAPTLIVANLVILKGKSFVPAGSTCPNTDDYIRIGTLGAHTITYTNAATGVTGPVFTDLWVCNSEDGRTFHWTSNSIDLTPGANPITVRMSTRSHSSEATIILQGSGQ